MSAAEPITYVRSEDLLGESFPTERARVPGLDRRRHVAGVVVAVVGLALLTLALTELRDTFSLESQVLLYLLAVDPLPPCQGKVKEWLYAALGTRSTASEPVAD